MATTNPYSKLDPATQRLLLAQNNTPQSELDQMTSQGGVNPPPDQIQGASADQYQSMPEPQQTSENNMPSVNAAMASGAIGPEDIDAYLAAQQGAQQQSPEAQKAMDQLRSQATGLRSQISELGQKSQAAGQAGINDLSNKIDNYLTRNQGYDMRPLAALLDSWGGGSNLTAVAGAMAPQSPQDRQQMAIALSEKLQNLKMGLDKEQLANLKEQLNSVVGEEKTNMLLGGHQQKQDDKAASDLKDYTKAVTNPTARGVLGRYRANIDNADAAIAFSRQIGMPEGQLAPDNESPEQRISRYNHADSRQVAEIVKTQDKLLSGSGVPTVEGYKSLTPPETPEELFAKYGEKALNIPMGVQKGAFIDRLLSTTNRERDLNASKFDESVRQIKKGFPRAAAVYGKEMDDIAKVGTHPVNFYQKASPAVQNNQQPKSSNSAGSSQNAPPIGAIVNGYKFNGGNHRDPSNWEKVQ